MEEQRPQGESSSFRVLITTESTPFIRPDWDLPGLRNCPAILRRSVLDDFPASTPGFVPCRKVALFRNSPLSIYLF